MDRSQAQPAPHRTHRRRALAQVGWALALWLLLQLVLAVPYVMLQGLRGELGAVPRASAEGMVVSAVIGTLATLATIWWMRRREGLWESLRTWGLRPGPAWPAEAALGLALGPLLFGLVFGVGVAAGWVQGVSVEADGLAMLQGLLVTLLVAFSEEVLMRGYVLQTLLPAWGLRASLLLQAGIFAVLHGLNPGMSPAAVVNLAVSGLVFGYAWKATGRLWLPIGLHLSWNFAEGPLFGFPVSGMPFPSLLHHQVVGPAWAMGGPFGPEAGLLGLGATCLAFAAVYLWERFAAASR